MIETIVFAVLLFQAPGHVTAAAQFDPLDYEGEWIVEVVDNITLLPESRVTMTIRRMSIRGMAPCNSYQGSFAATGHNVKISQLLKTMKSCDTTRMSEETDFFALLSAVTSGEVHGKQTLVLTTRDGKKITARRATQSSSRRD